MEEEDRCWRRRMGVGGGGWAVEAEDVHWRKKIGVGGGGWVLEKDTGFFIIIHID